MLHLVGHFVCTYVCVYIYIYVCLCAQCVCVCVCVCVYIYMYIYRERDREKTMHGTMNLKFLLILQPPYPCDCALLGSNLGNTAVSRSVDTTRKKAHVVNNLQW
jgi:hypothetical protein